MANKFVEIAIGAAGKVKSMWKDLGRGVFAQVVFAQMALPIRNVYNAPVGAAAGEQAVGAGRLISIHATTDIWWRDAPAGFALTNENGVPLAAGAIYYHIVSSAALIHYVRQEIDGRVVIVDHGREFA